MGRGESEGWAGGECGSLVEGMEKCVGLNSVECSISDIFVVLLWMRVEWWVCVCVCVCMCVCVHVKDSPVSLLGLLLGDRDKAESTTLYQVCVEGSHVLEGRVAAGAGVGDSGLRVGHTRGQLGLHLRCGGSRQRQHAGLGSGWLELVPESMGHESLALQHGVCAPH